MQRIHEKILEIRKKSKLTRKGLEHISGFKERTIASYERGERSLSHEYLTFIRLYFNIQKECMDENYIPPAQTKEYSEATGKQEVVDVCKMPKTRLVIEYYKAILNLTEESVRKLFNLKVDDYASFLDYDENSIDDLIKICKPLKIKPSSFILDFENMERVSTYGYMYDSNLKKKSKEEQRKGYQVDVDKRELKIDILRKFENDLDFIFYSEEYYLLILNKRNISEVYIPKNEKTSNIKNEYQEIVSLLDYVPKSFVSKLLIKLKNIKKEQDSLL